MTISLEEHVARAIRDELARQYRDKARGGVYDLLARAAIAAVREYETSPMHFAELCQDNADLRSSADSIRESERAACEIAARGEPWVPGRYNHYYCEVGEAENPDAVNWASYGDYARARNSAADAIAARKGKS